MGWDCCSSEQLSAFRRHPSTAAATFWLSGDSHPMALDPEDLHHERDGWFTIPLVSAWADRYLGHYIGCCYAPFFVDGSPVVQPTTVQQWIALLDELSASTCSSAFLGHTSPSGDHGRGHCYALRRWASRWYVLDSPTGGKLPLVPGMPLPHLLSVPVSLHHLVPRPVNRASVVDAGAFLPIPTKGTSSAPVHPAPLPGQADAAVGGDCDRGRRGERPSPRCPPGRRTTRAASAASVHDSKAWENAFACAVRDTFRNGCGQRNVDAQRVSGIVTHLVLQHVRDLKGRDPHAPATQRIITGLVRADLDRNNRGLGLAPTTAAPQRSPYDFPSDSSSDGEPARSGRLSGAAKGSAGQRRAGQAK